MVVLGGDGGGGGGGDGDGGVGVVLENKAHPSLGLGWTEQKIFRSVIISKFACIN